jgi:N-sulfoglucosamine sulfohydrolase
MVTWADLAPTVLDLAGVTVPAGTMDGRSFRAGLDGEDLRDWDEVFASHSFHEITMYYPMRVVRTRRHKLIWNVASGLVYPSALDLIKSPSWISVTSTGGTKFGARTVEAYLRRPAFELYDLERDPDEVVNLADDPAHRRLQAELLAKLKAFQAATRDPWFRKWSHE